MKRHLAVVVLLAVSAGLLTGCGNKKTETAQKLLAAISATEKQPRKYLYTDIDARGVKTQVAGIVEDDFRHKERLTINGEVAADEVVSDDSLAVRVNSEPVLSRMINRNPIPPLTAAKSGEESEDEPTLADSLNALKTKVWVLDPAGAPPLVRLSTLGPNGVERDPVAGDDPFLDAIDLFNYARRAIASAYEVQEFNPEAINYKPSEDPFPKPRIPGPVIRYDLVRPFIPSAVQQAGGGRSNIPAAQHFRKMAIYVRSGHVEAIREELYPAERLKQTIDRGLAFLKKAGASKAIQDRTRALKKAPKLEASVAIIGAINVLRERNGDVPIRLRAMRFEISDLGSRDLHVLLPTETTRGPLDILKNRGRTASLPAANSASSGAGQSTTTTTVEGGTESTETTTSAPPP